MGIIRSATPGTLVCLTATILLAIVSFCVPYFKSVYFLRADISVGGQNGSITFGTLGYCYDVPGNSSCSKPSVGYELDINSLVGNKLPVEIPQVAVKWLTYALVLHIVALALAAGSTVFGILAHVREMSMTCCSTCISGFAAGVALLAFIFDIALFFIAKSRINAIGHASFGNATWLTLAAWVLLFFSGCFYSLGRCCISSRGPRNKKKKWDNDNAESGHGNRSGSSDGGHKPYAEQMRMDAVKAEADRKARQKEVGLPAFYESQPLTGRVDGDAVYSDTPYSDNAHPASPTRAHSNTTSTSGGYAGGGYVKQPVGSRAVDEYYRPTDTGTVAAAVANSYPPQPRRQASAHSYAPSGFTHASSPPPGIPVPTSTPPSNQYLATGNQQYGNQQYGHAAGGSTYYSAHEQYPSSYSQYDPYNSQQQQPQPFHDPYGQHTPSPQGYNSHATSYYSAQTPGVAAPDRSYTLGGDGYGANSVPPLAERQNSVPALPEHPSSTTYVPFANSSSPPPQGHSQNPHEESPPSYDPGFNPPVGSWGKQ